MTELQELAYRELYTALTDYGKHSWVECPERPAIQIRCPAVQAPPGECRCGLANALALLKPEDIL